MDYQTLIEPAELAAHLDDPDWAIFDCRFALNDPAAGERDYAAGHIPSALYAHLDRDLTAPIISGKTGRHPLPEAHAFAQKLSEWGVDEQVQVVAYDSNGMTAPRLWWMLRWLGHDKVAVLNGGWAAWLRGGFPVSTAQESREARVFKARERVELVADAGEVLRLSADPTYEVVDSRAADRYRGENETIDPVAGHIPGAANLPYMGNLDAEGRFLPVEQLRERLQKVLGNVPARRAIFYCGSGVSAANNVLAAAHAGLGEARLYPGSWSEWITHPTYPRATGDEPA